MDIRNFFGKKQPTALKSNARTNETKNDVKKKSVEVRKNEGLESDSDATTDMPLQHDIRNSSQNKSESSEKGKIHVEDLDGEETDFSESSPTVQNKTKIKTETVLSKKEIIDSQESNNHHRAEQKKAKASGKRIIQEDSESDDDFLESPKTIGQKRKSQLPRNKVINNEEGSEESASLQSPKKRKANRTRKHISDTDDDTDEDFSLAAKSIQRKTNLMKNPKHSESEDTSDEEFNSPKRKITSKKVAKQTKPTKSKDLVPEKRKTVPSSRGASRKKPSNNKKNDAEEDESTTISQQPSPKPKARKKDISSPKKNNKPILLEPSTSLSSFSTEQAAPECLSGLTFVFSGILDTLGRDESIDYVKILGGRVTTAVSRKTSYLVVGSTLEDGRPVSEGSKYQKASELGIRIVEGASKFFGLCQLYSDQVIMRRGDDCNLDPTESLDPAKQMNPDCETQTSVSDLQPTPTKASVNPYAKKSNPYAKVNLYASKKTSTSGSVDAAIAPSKGPHSGDPNDLWVDKYAPTSTHDILGNQESVKKLTVWLSKWEDTFNHEKAYGKSFSSPTGPWKAALLSGPPGIGKTTTAMLVAKENGRDILELNASDARSKKAMSLELGDVTGSQVISFGGVGVGRKGSKSTVAKHCLVMDEVDGMGGGDRGGIAELITIIKKSRVPIICICNDRQSQKIKSLLPHCLDLRFKRPVKSVIARRALRIGEMEGMKVELNAVEAIAESCGNDIRQVLNCLQMWSSSKAGGKSLTYKGLKERESSINKDEILRVNMFDATKQIIEGRRGLAGSDAKAAKDSLYKRSDAFFVDYSLIGLNIHQNYLKVMVGGYQDAVRSKDDTKLDEFVERMHDATLAMSDFAVGEQAVRGGDMNWSLLPFISMMAVKTGYHAGGENGGFLSGYPEFAGWMGKNSTRGKKLRLLHELSYHMNYKISTDETDLRLFYIPILRERLIGLLGNGEKANITEAIALMDEYGLDRDDVFEHMDEFRIDSKAKGFSDIDSKQKAAFTREYNQGAHKSQALVHEQGISNRKTSKRGSTMESLIRMDQDVVDDDRVGDDEVDEEVEDDDEMTEEKLKQIFGKKSKGRTSEGSKGATSRKRKGK